LHLRLTVAPETATEMITAMAPGILADKPKAQYLIARRKGDNLSSTFLAVAEPYAASAAPAITHVERIPVIGPERTGEAVAVRLRSGTADGFAYSSRESEPHRAGSITAGARFAYARTEGDSLIALSLVGASLWESHGWRITPRTSAWNGSISSVDYKTGVITLDAILPEGNALKGKIVVFSGSGYTRNAPFRIQKVEREGSHSCLFVEGPLDTGRGIIGKIESKTSMESLIGHEYARPVRSDQSTGFFDGKVLLTDSGASTRIRSTKPGVPLKMTVDSTVDLKSGETFHFYEIAVGDRFEILPTISLMRTTLRQYELTSDVEVTVVPPDNSYTVRKNDH
jgi:hypothetical protein